MTQTRLQDSDRRGDPPRIRPEDGPAPPASPGAAMLPPEPAWERVACNLCGSDDHALYQRERVPFFDRELDFEIVRCRACGLVFTNPRLSAVNAVYEADDTFCESAVEAHGRAKEPVFRAALARLARYLPDEPAAGGPTLLDVGCGPGHFMQLARQQGYHPVGIEPAALPAAYARDHFGLEVLPMNVEDVELPANRFDAITAFDVIEHVSDPRALLTRCATWLRPGGVMVLRFPSAPWQKFKATFYRRIPGCRRWSFGPAMHLTFFTRQTFTRMARQAGLEPIAFGLTPMEVGPGEGMRGLLKRACGAVLTGVYRLTGRIGGNLEVYCRKCGDGPPR